MANLWPKNHRFEDGILQIGAARFPQNLKGLVPIWFISHHPSGVPAMGFCHVQPPHNGHRLDTLDPSSTKRPVFLIFAGTPKK